MDIFTPPVVRLARIGRLPDNLKLSFILELAFYADGLLSSPIKNIGAYISFSVSITRMINDGLIQAESFIHHDDDVKVFFCLCVDGDNKRAEPVLSKDSVKLFLESMEAWPIDNDCLLSAWWDKQSQPAEQSQVKKISDINNEQRNDSLNRWCISHPEHSEMTKHEVFEALKKYDPVPWSSKGTFNNWWSKRKDLKRTKGRKCGKN